MANQFAALEQQMEPAAPKAIYGNDAWQDKRRQLSWAFQLSWMALVASRAAGIADLPAAAHAGRQEHTYITNPSGSPGRFFRAILEPSSVIVSRDRHSGVIAGREFAGRAVLATALRFPDAPITTPTAQQNGYPAATYGRPLITLETPWTPGRQVNRSEDIALLLGERRMPADFAVYLGQMALSDITVVSMRDLAAEAQHPAADYLDYSQVAHVLDNRHVPVPTLPQPLPRIVSLPLPQAA